MRIHLAVPPVITPPGVPTAVPDVAVPHPSAPSPTSAPPSTRVVNPPSRRAAKPLPTPPTPLPSPRHQFLQPVILPTCFFALLLPSSSSSSFFFSALASAGVEFVCPCFHGQNLSLPPPLLESAPAASSLLTPSRWRAPLGDRGWQGSSTSRNSQGSDFRAAHARSPRHSHQGNESWPQQRCGAPPRSLPRTQ